MIRPIDIRLNAAHPELPLVEATTFTGSPSTVLIRGVPPNCGRWAITAVFVAASFPDGSTTTRAAVQSANGVWVATLPATARSGRTANGLRVLADGIDENGEAVTGYILGVADFAVASLDVTPAPEPGSIAYALRYFDTLPDPAKKGDVIRVNGGLKFYNGTAWQPFTDLSNYYTAEQVDEAIDKLAAYYITADAQGNPFATKAALVNAQTYYSGGAVRTPTRNDYAVVTADETHGGAEWRYIYAVDAQGVGQWEPQYAVEGVIAYDDTVTRTSSNGVKSSGIWSAIWGTASTAFSSLYDWVVAQLAGKQNALSPPQLANIAAISDAIAFDATHSYAAGDPVVYDGTLYTFTTEHTGAWTGSDVSAVDIIAMLAGKLDKSGGTVTGTLTVDPRKSSYRVQLGDPPSSDAASRAGVWWGEVLPCGIYCDSLGGDLKILSEGAIISLPSAAGTLALTAGEGYVGNLAALDSQGNPTDSQIPAANVAVKSDLRYALTTKTISNNAVTLDDRASNAVTISTTLSPNTLTINFPTATSGKVRDFGLRLTVASGITTAPQLVLPQGVTCENADGAAPEIGADGAATILYFTETAAGVFLVKGEVVTAIS